MFFNKFKLWRFVAILVIGALVGCTSQFSENLANNDPKKVLADYISQSFSVKTLEDRKSLLSYMTGDVKLRLSSWSEDQFREAFLEPKRDFLKLSIQEVREISPNEVQITYELAYMIKNQPNKSHSNESKITNRKLCQMSLEEGKWRISNVKNIKELIEFKDELSLP